MILTEQEKRSLKGYVYRELAAKFGSRKAVTEVTDSVVDAVCEWLAKNKGDDDAA